MKLKAFGKFQIENFNVDLSTDDTIEVVYFAVAVNDKTNVEVNL